MNLATLPPAGVLASKIRGYLFGTTIGNIAGRDGRPNDISTIISLLVPLSIQNGPAVWHQMHTATIEPTLRQVIAAHLHELIELNYCHHRQIINARSYKRNRPWVLQPAGMSLKQR